MSTAQPIRRKDQLVQFKNFYLSREENIRNYTLVAMGLNTALRISDILRLTWEDVFDGDKVRSHITVKEKKTGKENRILLNKELKRILISYRKSFLKQKDRDAGNPYLFPSPKKKGSHLSRFQAYRIMRHAAEILNLEPGISCHSLRKTFGYQAWKKGFQPALLMELFNHSSWRITLRYLGIGQDEKDEVYRKVII